MRFLSLLATFFVLFGCLANAPAQDSKADPREKLETAIPEAIRLLEAKDYAKLLKNFVKPEDFKRITEQMPLEDFAKEFGKAKADGLMAALKAIKDVKPKLEEDDKKATFVFKEPIGGKESMIFVKVDKYWYISD
jgi:hypothetical protein